MQFKLKKCDRCQKEKPIWKNQTVEGEKKKFCKTCYNIVNRTLKKEKLKKQREKKRSIITEKKLDQVFSKLVRNIYPPVCHSSGDPITVETSHCAHLIGRNNRCLRWDLRNCFPTKPEENLYNQLHIIYLGKKLEYYYGIKIEDWDAQSKQQICKLSRVEKKEMYDIFKQYLDKVLEAKRVISDTQVLDKRLSEYRLEIINLTKKIL